MLAAMDITMSQDEFAVVYEALRLANQPYTDDEVAHLVAMERKAWRILEEVARRSSGPPA
jgi:hypothetical protein